MHGSTISGSYSAERVDADTSYAIDSVASLEPMLGPEVTEACAMG